MTTRKKGDGLSDKDLLVLCALADVVHREQTRRLLRPVEHDFLNMMIARDLWSPPNEER